MAKPTDKQMAAFRKLGYSDEQIAEMLEDDAAVDRGEKMEWDLSADEHKKAMKHANADEHKKPAVYKFEQKTAKKNTPKLEIMEKIFEFLSTNCDLEFENLQIVEMPTQKKVEITYRGENFTLALTNHRKK